MVVIFECIIDVKVYIASIRVKSFRILVDQLLESLEKHILRLLLLLQ